MRSDLLGSAGGRGQQVLERLVAPFVTGIFAGDTEKLSVGVNTVPQTGLGLSLSNLITPLTQVGGTLAKPTLALNAEGAIIQGGAAVATAGISFLATRFKDRYLSAKDACGKAIDDSRDRFTRLQEQYAVRQQ